jgi:hypothetical protein
MRICQKLHKSRVLADLIDAKDTYCRNYYPFLDKGKPNFDIVGVTGSIPVSSTITKLIS